jgi:prolyl-tRNA synthetase
VVEASHDDNGIVWPVSVAPYEVVITALRTDDGPTMDTAHRLYQELTEAGIEVLLDDRDERPGVKFADSELIGIPYRVTVGPRGVTDGVMELTARRGMVRSDVPLTDLVTTVRGVVESERFGTEVT